MLSFIRILFRQIIVIPIRLYQILISPLKPRSCIYSPTCSAYCRDAFLKHGLFRGLILGCTRIFRCAGGLFAGGEDPVPDEFSFSRIRDEYSRRWLRKR